MAVVLVTCRNYQGAYLPLNGRYHIDVTQWRFIAASLTLGFQRFRQVLAAGPRLWTHRLGLGLTGSAYLGDVQGNLCLTPDHVELDGSEKGAMSYWQGMVFAKLAAAEVLGIRWLQHADAMERQNRLQRDGNPMRGRRADMAGRDDAGLWHVVEAKGFSSHPGLPAIDAAKIQAGMVTSVNQVVPETTTGCVTSLWKTPIETVMDDPKPEGNEQWLIEDNDFWQQYYGGLADFIRDAPPTKGSDMHLGFTFASLAPLFGVVPLNLRPKEWQPPMIGLPDQLLKDVNTAGEVLPRLLADGPLDRVTEDGIALIGSVGEWSKVAYNIRGDY